MDRPAWLVPDIDGDDLTSGDQIADRSKEKCTAPRISCRLDDQLGAQLGDQFLVDPQVERTLQHARAEPERISPGGLAAGIIEAMELVHGRVWHDDHSLRTGAAER